MTGHKNGAAFESQNHLLLSRQRLCVASSQIQKSSDSNQIKRSQKANIEFKRKLICSTFHIKLVTHQVKGGLLLDVVVGESSSVLELLSSEDQTLLVRGDSLLVLDSNLQIILVNDW